jgi:hypothetical protein
VMVRFGRDILTDDTDMFGAIVSLQDAHPSPTSRWTPLTVLLVG